MVTKYLIFLLLQLSLLISFFNSCCLQHPTPNVNFNLATTFLGQVTDFISCLNGKENRDFLIQVNSQAQTWIVFAGY